MAVVLAVATAFGVVDAAAGADAAGAGPGVIPLCPEVSRSMSSWIVTFCETFFWSISRGACDYRRFEYRAASSASPTAVLLAMTLALRPAFSLARTPATMQRGELVMHVVERVARH